MHLNENENNAKMILNKYDLPKDMYIVPMSILNVPIIVPARRILRECKT